MGELMPIRDYLSNQMADDSDYVQFVKKSLCDLGVDMTGDTTEQKPMSGTKELFGMFVSCAKDDSADDALTIRLAALLVAVWTYTDWAMGVKRRSAASDKMDTNQVGESSTVDVMLGSQGGGTMADTVRRVSCLLVDRRGSTSNQALTQHLRALVDNRGASLSANGKQRVSSKFEQALIDIKRFLDTAWEQRWGGGKRQTTM